jgi:hypothetical protein
MTKRKRMIVRRETQMRTKTRRRKKMRMMMMKTHKNTMKQEKNQINQTLTRYTNQSFNINKEMSIKNWINS